MLDNTKDLVQVVHLSILYLFNKSVHASSIAFDIQNKISAENIYNMLNYEQKFFLLRNHNFCDINILSWDDDVNNARKQRGITMCPVCGQAKCVHKLEIK